MGTRGAFGVIIGEQEKIGYNQFDSYPDGKGIEILSWLNGIMQHRRISKSMGIEPRPDDPMDEVAKFRRLAEACRLVDDDTPITDEDCDRLRGFWDTGVSTGEDWYAMTRDTHGSLELMLRVGYIYDSHKFPLDSLFCEWAYIVDFDNEVFEVYEGFQKERPTKGRWAGRPTDEENAENYKAHLALAKKQGRDPWDTEVPKYKAVELVASWSFDDLPTQEEFLAAMPKYEDEEALV